ncbi:MAG TPA: hypothetical protein VN682_00010 [Terriglobales bacterium]|nr:hypothetical protein [Terriglobales bacterium]HXF12392.1 hypothetical protein [Terriglobales bacterium]
MARTQITADQHGLVNKPYSARLGMTVIASMGFSAISGWLLAFDFLGYHAPGCPPHRQISALLLVLGLFLAVIGQLLGARRNEGIRARGWMGIIDVLLIRLAFAAMVFIGSVLKFALAGKQIHFYPVGVLTIVSGFLLASRLAVKFIFHIDRQRRMRAV